MDIERLDKLGQGAYEALGRCVEESLEEESSEHALICASALVKLADAEGANYFGTQGYYNYNTAMELGKRVLDFVEKEGVPSWMKDDAKQMLQTLRNGGWLDEKKKFPWIEEEPLKA